jgi:L-fucose isomerase-like protein
MAERPVLGLIVGNRAGFPDILVVEGRAALLRYLDDLGVDVVTPDESLTPLGAVESWDDAQRCARLFRSEADRIDGILVSLPNFGDEKGIADAIRLAGLNVPVLVQAFPDDAENLAFGRRRDSFCGKVSVCNNLTQTGSPFSLTSVHTLDLAEDEFRDDLQRFIATCRVVRGLRGVRLGMVGTRPDAFRTVRFSEKLLEASAISMSVIDLSDVRGRVDRLADGDQRVAQKLADLRSYVQIDGVPEEPLLRMARFAVVLDGWMQDNGLQGVAIQCWDSMQHNFGFSACGIMSLLSDKLIPAACEADVTGLVSMYALKLASGTPSVLADWNNNYGRERDKCVFWHCGYFAKSFVPDLVMGQHPSPDLPNSWGTLHGRASSSDLTFARITTDDVAGRIRAYVGEGRITDDPLDTYGTPAVVEITGLQKLLRHMCRNGFEHHVAMSRSLVADAVTEAFGTYLGWDVYRHGADTVA